MTNQTDAALAAIRAQNVRFVRFVWTDNAGLIRAKAVHFSALEPMLSGSGVGIAAAQQAVPVMYDALSPGAGLTPVGEVVLQADWSTLAALPYAPGHARVLTDIVDGSQPWALCPRDFLRRMIARAAGLGLQVKAAFENEFYLLRMDGDSWSPADRSLFAQSSSLDRAAPVLDDMAAALEAQGVVPELLHAESGPGQFEIPVRYTDALRAADQQVIFRETVRAVAYRHGLVASFVPKVFADQAGSGAHLHFSLWQGDQNLVADPQRPGALSSQSTAFVAGLLLHLPALMAFTTPSTNSYKRIRPHFWSGAFACWGYGNREAAVRVPMPVSPAAPLSHLELKTVDPSCNPYLALGAVLAAGLDGLERSLHLGDPVRVDPADLPEAERRSRGIRALPSSLDQALMALEQDRPLLEALEPDLARAFVAVRRAEWEAMKDLSHDDEVRLLLERY